MTEEDVWSRPPFWAEGHGTDENRRRDFKQLRRLKLLWRRANPETQLWFKRLEELQAMERKLGLTQTQFVKGQSSDGI